MPIGPKDYLKLGDWNATCDSCDFKFKFSELKKDWKGLMKCSTCWEPRHPMDLQKPPRPTQPLPEVRPDKGVQGDAVPTTVANSFPISVQVANSAGTGWATIPTGNFETNNKTYDNV